MDNYIKGKIIGEGTFGVVYEGWIKEPTGEKGRRVAMKRMNLGENRATEGIRFNDLREVECLRELKHDNIVDLLDIFIHKQNMWLVLEYCITDLEKLIRYLRTENKALSEANIKSLMKMLLEGLKVCHDNWILHRDLKPGNLFIDHKGVLKLGDFGLSRTFATSFTESLTPTVITRWYRPPELFFGAKNYTTSVDMWSVGCILAELFLLNPYFPGENDLDQVSTIFQALGTPTERQWPNMKDLPFYIEFTECQGTPFKNVLTAASAEAIDLLEKLLVYDPTKRLTVQEVLNHKFFGGEITPPEQIPLPPEVTEPEVHVVTNVRNVVEELKDSEDIATITRSLNFDDV